jgi:hypothetical protein
VGSLPAPGTRRPTTKIIIILCVDEITIAELGEDLKRTAERGQESRARRVPAIRVGTVGPHPEVVQARLLDP